MAQRCVPDVMNEQLIVTAADRFTEDKLACHSNTAQIALCAGWVDTWQKMTKSASKAVDCMHDFFQRKCGIKSEVCSGF